MDQNPPDRDRRSGPVGDGSIDAGVVDERRHLLDVGYRLLGSLAEAEDAVQETYFRWYSLTPDERAAIETPVAWLTTVTSRVCLDQLKSARMRRERYVGEWLPEPVPATTTGPSVGGGPAETVSLDDSVNMALLVVLETMTPAERVSFILHDVFRYPFAEIAAIVGRSAAACRQLATSARRRVDASVAGVAVPVTEERRLVAEFKRAWEERDVDRLVGLLDPEATVVADGGGVVNAARRPVSGGPRLARYLVKLADNDEAAGLELVETTVNGRPGLTGHLDGQTVLALAVGVDEGRIRNLWIVANPEKLRPWNTGPT